VFTTFIAFEWTSLEKGNNLHRNVIFRDDADLAGTVVPYTTTPPQGSNDPRDLWKWMQAYEDKTGGDVTAIPHNGNLSNGMMFPLVDNFVEGEPALEPAYAEMRNKFARIYEVTQPKGDGEAHPSLSPDDEFAEFETWDWGNLDLSEAKTPEMFHGEYIRPGLARGMKLEKELGSKPFKVGLVGATDIDTDLSSVDLSIPSWTNTIGSSELGTVWNDPDFDPELSAFYYARVIEIPTPRWTAYDAVKFDIEFSEEVPLKTQERAYTSPIWYTPDT